MKRYLFIPLLALMLLFAACGKEESSKATKAKANAYAHHTSGFGLVNGNILLIIYLYGFAMKEHCK